MDDGFALSEALVAEFGGHSRVTPSIAPHAPYSTDVAVMRRVASWVEKNPSVVSAVFDVSDAVDAEALQWDVGEIVELRGRTKPTQLARPVRLASASPAVSPS